VRLLHSTQCRFLTKRLTRCKNSSSRFWFCHTHWISFWLWSIGLVLTCIGLVFAHLSERGLNVVIGEWLLKDRPILSVEINQKPLTEETVFQIPYTNETATFNVSVYNGGKAVADNVFVTMKIMENGTNWIEGAGWTFPIPNEGAVDFQHQLRDLPEDVRTYATPLTLKTTNFLSFGAIIYGVCSRNRTKPLRVHFITHRGITNSVRLDGVTASAYLKQVFKTNLPPKMIRNVPRRRR
jgi:hypothetical protein